MPVRRPWLVSAGNSFIEKALALLPQVRLARVLPGNYKPGPGSDLTLFDGYLPATLPPGNLLLINPPDSPLVPVSGTLAYPVLGPREGDDPLLRYVNLDDLHIAEAARMQTPAWARTLVRTTGGDPLLLAGETAGRRVAVIGFDLHKSDLALQVGFPILLANLVGWLAPGSALDLPPRLTPRQRPGDPSPTRSRPRSCGHPCRTRHARPHGQPHRRRGSIVQ